MAWLDVAQHDGLGTHVQGPTIVGVQVEILLKYLTIGCMLVASVMFYVWSRVDVRGATADLERERNKHYALQVESERLELELATRRDVGHLQRVSKAMGFVGGVDVVEIRAQ